MQTMTQFRPAVSVAVALCAVLFGLCAHAQDYPSRPVRIVVPFAPGGPNDIIARVVGQRMSELTRQPVIIENRSGQAGVLGTDAVAKAAPDGYTIGITSASSLVINPSLEKMPYDVRKDLAPVTLNVTVPEMLVVASNVPANNMAELIALAKAQPGRLNFASSGYGAAAHLAGELFKTQAHVDIVHVAYKGAAPALQDLIAGHVQVMFATSASVIGFLKAGTLRPLAVTTLKRFSLMPELPTVAELGLPGFDATTWHGLVAPAATPKPVIDTLNRAMVQALADPDTLRQLHDLGVEVGSSTPAEFAAYIKSEIPKWAAVVKASGAQVE